MSACSMSARFNIIVGTHPRRYCFRSLNNRLRNDVAKVGVDLFEFLQEMWHCLAIVCLEHGVGCMKLLNVGVVRLDVLRQRMLRWIMTMSAEALFVFNSALREFLFSLGYDGFE